LAPLMAVALGACLSLSLETLQNFLPSRVPSNLDLASNSIGALLGALAGIRWGAQLLDGGQLHALRTRLVGESKMADAGLLLLALWLLTLLNPEILLFGNGDLRSILGSLGVPPTLPYNANHFSWLEAGIAASNTLALGLLIGCLLRTQRRPLTATLLVLALGVKTFSLALLMSDGSSLSWATPGNIAGLGAGAALWLAASFLPSLLRQALAALSLFLGTTLVNLAPENPYLAAILQVWQQGHFLNFNGLTRLTSALWPFVALPWLMLLRQERVDKP
jgi:VanZ family protein